MHIVFLIFDRITALDAVGPYEVLARLSGAKVTFAAPVRGTVRTDNGALGPRPRRPVSGRNRIRMKLRLWRLDLSRQAAQIGTSSSASSSSPRR
jgi:putative intracellular protease/amidase